MALKHIKIGFLFLVSVSLYFAIPIRRVTAQDYMFCAIFTDGRPAATNCEDSLENCMRMNDINGSNGDKICVARPRTSDLQQ